MEVIKTEKAAPPATLTYVELEWLRTRSFAELVEHLASASPNNRMHNGEAGKLFSDLMDEKRAKLSAEEAMALQAAALANVQPWKGLVH